MFVKIKNLFTPKNKKSIAVTDMSSLFSGITSSSKTRYSDTQSSLEGYTDLEWVGISIDRIYDAIIQQDFYFEDSGGKLIEPSRLNTALKTIFYDQRFNLNEMMATITAHTKLVGNGYLLVSRSTAYGVAYNLPYDSINVINPKNVIIWKTQNELAIDHYEVRLGDGKILKITPNDQQTKLIHVKQYPIFDPFVGVGNMTKLRLLAEGWASQKEWINEEAQKKGAQSIGIIDKTQRSPEDRMRFQMQLSDKIENQKKTGKVIYLNIDGSVQAFPVSYRDMQWVEREELDRQAILSMFGVPPVVAGIPDKSNRNTAETAYDEFYRNTINPALKTIERAIQIQLVNAIDPNVFFRVQKYATGDLERVSKMVQTGIITLNRASEIMGEQWDANDDDRSQFYLPSNLVPIGMIDHENQPQDNTEDSKKKIFDLTPKHLDLVVNNFLKSATQPKKFQSKYIVASLKSIMAIEDKYTYKISQYFIDAGKRIASKIGENEDMFNVELQKKAYDSLVGAILNLDEEDKELKRVMQSVWISGVQRAIGDINIITGAKVNLNTSNPFVSQAVRTLGSRIVGTYDKNGFRISINETTRKEVEKIITQSINDAVSINQIQDRIQDKFKGFAGYRARRIARTEARMAWDYGAQVAYTEIGVKTVDVVGCTMFEINSDCGKQDIPVRAISTLSFHPNHIGTPAPSEENDSFGLLGAGSLPTII